MIGMAQEKASVWRPWPRKGQEKARHPHMDWGRQMAFMSHFYFYLWFRTRVINPGAEQFMHLRVTGLRTYT